MKSKAFAAQIRDPKLRHCSSSLGALADIDVTHVVELPGLHVQIAIGQTGRLLHLHECNRQAGNKGGQDAKATGGAYHLVELKLHEVIYFVSRSISSNSTPVKHAQCHVGLITLFCEVMCTKGYGLLGFGFYR